jgi:hypothetical protein
MSDIVTESIGESDSRGTAPRVPGVAWASSRGSEASTLGDQQPPPNEDTYVGPLAVNVIRKELRDLNVNLTAALHQISSDAALREERLAKLAAEREERLAKLAAEREERLAKATAEREERLAKEAAERGEHFLNALRQISYDAALREERLAKEAADRNQALMAIVSELSKK